MTINLNIVLLEKIPLIKKQYYILKCFYPINIFYLNRSTFISFETYLHNIIKVILILRFKLNLITFMCYRINYSQVL